MSKVIKDKIMSIKENGYYGELPKTKVSFLKSGEWTFFSKQFPGNVGDMLSFTVSNAKHKTAKHPDVIGKHETQNPFSGLKEINETAPWTTGEQIVRNVAYKGVIDLIAANIIKPEHLHSEVNNHHKILISKF